MDKDNFDNNRPMPAEKDDENNRNLINVGQGAIKRTTTTNKNNSNTDFSHFNQSDNEISLPDITGTSNMDSIQTSNPNENLFNRNLDYDVNNLNFGQLTVDIRRRDTDDVTQLPSTSNSQNDYPPLAKKDLCQPAIPFVQILTHYVQTRIKKIDKCFCFDTPCVCNFIISLLFDRILTPKTVVRFNIFYSQLWSCEIFKTSSFPAIMERKSSPKHMCAYSFFNGSTICDMNRLSFCKTCSTIYCSKCLQSDYHSFLCSKQKFYDTAKLKQYLKIITDKFNRMVRMYQMKLISGAALLDKSDTVNNFYSIQIVDIRVLVLRRQREHEQQVRDFIEMKSIKQSQLKSLYNEQYDQFNQLLINTTYTSAQIFRRMLRISNKFRQIKCLLDNLNATKCRFVTSRKDTIFSKIFENFAVVRTQRHSYDELKYKLAQRLAENSIKKASIYFPKGTEINISIEDFLLPSMTPKPLQLPAFMPQQSQQQEQQIQQRQIQRFTLPENNSDRIVVHTNQHFRNNERSIQPRMAITNRDTAGIQPIATLIQHPSSFKTDCLSTQTLNNERPHYPLVFPHPTDMQNELTRPWGISVNNLNRIVITDRGQHCVKIYKCDGTYLTRFGKYGKYNGEFDRPTGIAISIKGQILVADKDNHRIQIFDHCFNHLRSIGRQGTNLGEFNYPWNVAISTQEIIAVADSRNARVQIFNSDGTILHHYTHFNGICFEHPRGVCFTPTNDLLVTDFNLHKIVRFGHRRTEYFGIEGTRQGEFQRPQGIICDTEGNIIIVDTNNNRLQVFDSTLKFKCVISRGLGSAIGQMNKPTDVALTTEGKLAIIDYFNYRVQIL